MDFSFLNSIYPVMTYASRITTEKSSRNRNSFGQREVTDYELDYITWGEGTMITDGNPHPAEKGCLFFRRPGMMVEGILPYSCYFIKIKLLGCDGSPFDNDWIPDDFPTVIKFEQTSQIEALFSNLYMEHTAQNEMVLFLTRTYLMQIFAFIYKEWVSKEQFRHLGQVTRDRYISILQTAKEIETNISRHFTLEELARSCGYSPYTFCRLFKKVTGKTPINFMNSCKITHARRMLLESDKSVKEILMECGFENESHFFTLFQKIVGCRPTEYRLRGRMW